MELFVVTSLRYLQESCNIEMSIPEWTGKSRGFTFISCPECVSNKLINLSEIDFLDTSINVEEASSTRKRVNQGNANSENKRPQVVGNKFLKNQNIFIKPNIVPGSWSYTKTVRSLRKNNIFGDSIPQRN